MLSYRQTRDGFYKIHLGDDILEVAASIFDGRPWSAQYVGGTSADGQELWQRWGRLIDIACHIDSQRGREVRFVRVLFEDLICAGEKGRRDFDAKRLRGLEINHKQVLGGLFNR